MHLDEERGTVVYDGPVFHHFLNITVSITAGCSCQYFKGIMLSSIPALHVSIWILMKTFLEKFHFLLKPVNAFS